MGTEVVRYDVDVEYPQEVRTMRGPPVGYAGVKTGTVRMELIASGKDLDRLIDLLQTITGERPTGYEQASLSTLTIPKSNEMQMLPTTTDDDMIGEVVE